MTAKAAEGIIDTYFGKILAVKQGYQTSDTGIKTNQKQINNY
jgi:hypothetical protein